jgi:hypothetical protein
LAVTNLFTPLTLPSADEAVRHTCFSCHESVKARDFVFARYAV